MTYKPSVQVKIKREEEGAKAWTDEKYFNWETNCKPVSFLVPPIPSLTVVLALYVRRWLELRGYPSRHDELMMMMTISQMQILTIGSPYQVFYNLIQIKLFMFNTQSNVVKLIDNFSAILIPLRL